MQQILLATTDKNSVAKAEMEILDREALFYEDELKLMIKSDGKMNPISANPDNKNIIKSANNDISLRDNIIIKTSNVLPAVDGVPIITRKLNDKPMDNRVYLIMEYNDQTLTSFIGNLFRDNTYATSAYFVNMSSDGKCFLRGSTFDEVEPSVVQVNLDGKKYIGLKYASPIMSDYYFHGYDGRSSLPPSNYLDSNLS